MAEKRRSGRCGDWSLSVLIACTVSERSRGLAALGGIAGCEMRLAMTRERRPTLGRWSPLLRVATKVALETTSGKTKKT